MSDTTLDAKVCKAIQDWARSWNEEIRPLFEGLAETTGLSRTEMFLLVITSDLRLLRDAYRELAKIQADLAPLQREVLSRTREELDETQEPWKEDP